MIICFCSFAQKDWIMIEKKDAGFKIAFPRQPEETVDETKSETGVLMLQMEKPFFISGCSW
jgi:hypothetical protein